MIFYIIENGHKNIPDNYTYFNNVDYKNYNSLSDQAKDLGVKIEIVSGSLVNAPKNIKEEFICFLNKNQLIPSNYLMNIVSLVNLDRNTSILCGPVIYDNPKLINYNINRYNKIRVMDITGEHHNYPSVNNIVISGPIYNKFMGYSPLVTPRGFCTNYNKLISFSTIGSVIYSNYIQTFCQINDSYKFFNHYYSVGYECKKFNRNVTEYEAFLESVKMAKERVAFNIGLAEAETQEILV